MCLDSSSTFLDSIIKAFLRRQNLNRYLNIEKEPAIHISERDDFRQRPYKAKALRNYKDCFSQLRLL